MEFCFSPQVLQYYLRLFSDYVRCQVSLVKRVIDQDENQQLLKIITPIVKPTAERQGAEPSSSSALSSTDLPTSASSSERPPRRTTSPSAKSSHQGSRSKSRSTVGKQLLVTLLLVTQTIRQALMVAQVRS